MNWILAIKTLGPVDLKNIHRDPLLRWFILLPVLIAAALRWGVPWLASTILNQFNFDITPYYVLITSFITMTMPLLVGTIIGFLLLDQRDDRTLHALAVTPLSLKGYLAYRIAAPLMISIALSIVVVRFSGMVEIGFESLLIASICAAPLAPLVALFLGAFAQNKVQGFALSKGSGIILVPPLAAWFIPLPWQLLFGISPTYWPVKVFWMAAGGERLLWTAALAGIGYQVVLLVLIMKRFERVSSRE
jgi:fluoroquinolone transport system permease protein